MIANLVTGSESKRLEASSCTFTHAEKLPCQLSYDDLKEKGFQLLIFLMTKHLYSFVHMAQVHKLTKLLAFCSTFPVTVHVVL